MIKNSAGNSNICCVSLAAPARKAVLRRRFQLKSGSSGRALLAVQAAVSVGIVLAAHPARAGNLGPSNTGIVLSNYGLGQNPFSLNAGTLVSAAGTAIFGNNDGAWTLTNAGTVASTGGNGVSLTVGGTISNSGTIFGATSALGQYGVIITENSGTIGNQGTVRGFTGAEISDGGSINNSAGAQISGSLLGVYVANVAGSLINAGVIVQTGSDIGAAAEMHGGYIGNSGRIGAVGIGVQNVGAAGTLGNAGTVSGATGVLFNFAGTVLNTDTISGAGIGVSFANGGYLSNSAAGMIVGGSFGVLAGGTVANIVNAGTIDPAGTAVELDAGGTVSNSGAILGGTVGVSIGGSLALLQNDGGYISGSSDGVVISARNGTMFNGGLIIGLGGSAGNAGVLMNGGYLYNQTAGTIGGWRDGVIGTGTLAMTVMNAGTIAGLTDTAVYLGGGGTVWNTGFVEGGTVGISIAGTTGALVTNNGFDDANVIDGTMAGVIIGASLGTLVNQGFIGQSGTGAGDAAVIMNGGYIYNQTGNCANNAGTIVGYSNGVIGIGTNALSIRNLGVIGGTADGYHIEAHGIVLGTLGGAIFNGDSAVTGAHIYSHSGAAIYSNYGSFAVVNFGLINGGDGIESFRQTSLGTGAVTVANFNQISGGDYGILINTGAGTIFNTGQIIGEDESGIYLGAGGTVTNRQLALIQGGFNGISGLGTLVGVYNRGIIQGFGNDGVKLSAGGQVTNVDYQKVSPFAFYEATITGAHDGVYISGGQGNVVNSGNIIGFGHNGVELKTGGEVFNTGYIAGLYNGVQIGYRLERTVQSGVLINEFGVITANEGDAAVLYGGGYVHNFDGGTIVNTSAEGYALAVYGPLGSSKVLNSGDILAQRSGQAVRMHNAGTVINYGYIHAGVAGVGVYLVAGGSVLNSGEIYAGTGIFSQHAGAAYVGNIGYIIGDTIGVHLAHGGYVNNTYASCDGPVTGVIYGRQTGVQIDGQSGSVNNYGYIAGGTSPGYQTYGVGVKLNHGGVVWNNDEAYDGGVISGTIFGGDVGVKISHGPGYVYNGGLIKGGTVGVALYGGGKVDNYTYWTWANCQLYYQRGTIAGGEIGVYGGPDGAVSLFNSGLISGSYAGVDLAGGGSISNQGASASILGDGYGVRVSGGLGYVDNSGTIWSSAFKGVYLQNGGTVVNEVGGVIAGPAFGVEISNYHGVYSAPGMLTNAGEISADWYAGTGVDLAEGGYVSNSVGGVIYGATGLFMYNRYDRYNTIINAGSVIGANGAAVSFFGGGYLSVYNQAGGTFTGSEEGVLGNVFQLGLTNAGSIFGGYSGVVLYDSGFVTITNLAGGTINGADGSGIFIPSPIVASISNAGRVTGSYDGVFVTSAAYARIDNQAGGTIQGGSANGIVLYDIGYAKVLNAGLVTGPNDGVSIVTGAGPLSGAFVYNQASGTITGRFENGVEIRSFNSAMVMNAGSIGGNVIGVQMTSDAYDRVANLGGGTISGHLGDGVYLYHNNQSFGNSTVYNAGLIEGADKGVILHGGSIASVTNIGSGTITGVNVGVNLEAFNNTLYNAGLIYSTAPFRAGVVADHHSATIVNMSSGTISGNDQGAYLSAQTNMVDNAGLIEAIGRNNVEASFAGLQVKYGANIINRQTGTITGHYYGILGQTSMFNLDNAGLISGPDYDGVRAEGSVISVLNEATGTITGSNDALYLDGGAVTLDNAGLITGGSDEYGVYADDSVSGVVINREHGTIYGGHTGVAIYDGVSSYVWNAGLIEGEYAVDQQNADNEVVNAGKIQGGYDGLYETGTLALLTNEAEGTISGAIYEGVYSDADSMTLDNAGIITGGSDEYGVEAEGTINAMVINRATGMIAAGYEGVGLFYGESSYVWNAGVIAGSFALDLENTDNVAVNVATGTISGSQDGVFFRYGAMLTNAGIIQGTTLAGAYLTDGGLVINNSTGTIGGGTFGVEIGYQNATLAAPGTVFNAGLIAGDATAGLWLADGGSVTNAAGGVITGGTYGVQAGYAGSTLATAATLFNAGVISGGGTGLALNQGGAVVNAGVITGGQDGIDVAPGQAASIENSGTIIGEEGAGVALQGGSLTNAVTGVIDGGTAGVVAGSGSVIVNAGTIADAPAAGHAGVVLSGTADLTNLPTGTITGAVGVLVSGNDATIVDEGAIISTDGGDAIQVLPTADPVQITLTTGSSIVGAIDGGGTAGQITLTGNNTLNDTVADFGPGSALTVAPGASWVGAGNWTIANVNNTGTFQAGMLNVPLNLTGNFTSSGTLQVIVTPTISTQVMVSGTATLSGNLAYIFAPGIYTPGKQYNFLSAAGGASGEFTGVSYVGATPAYVSKTTNVLITGNTLGSNLVLGRVAPLDDSVFADSEQNQANQAQAANDELFGKASGDSSANAAACAAAESVMPGHTSPHGTSTAAQMTSAVANAFCGAGGWIEATGSTSQIDNSGDALGYSANDAGFLAGLDRPVNGFGTKLGLAVGYDDSWLNDKAGGKASADTFRVGLYAAQPVGAFTLAADLMYGHADDTTTRETGIGATSASYGSDIVSGGVQVSTGMTLQGLSLKPAAGIKFASANGDSFAESAPALLAPFKVTGASSDYTSVQPYVNLGVSKVFVSQSQVIVTPNASIGFQLEAGDRGKAVDVTAPDGTKFATGHTNLDAGGAQIEAGISAGKNNWALYAKYSAFLSGNWTAQAGEAGLQVKF